jgi:membrane protease YdiL (CAAX protease family)
MAPPGTPPATRDPRRQVVAYIVLVLAISWAFEAYLITHGGVRAFGPAALAVLMWIPGLVSVALRLATRSGFGDVGFAAGRARHHAFALVVPLVLALLTAILGSALGMLDLALASTDSLARNWGVFVAMFAFGLFAAFGEELGWRGFLLPKALAAGIARPFLLTGVVWAAWHLPLVLLGGFYATRHAVAMTLAYAAMIVAMSFVLSELRVRSGSVWVATVMHAAHNFFFQVAIPAALFANARPRGEWWEVIGGDSGAAVALLYVGVFVGWRRLRRKR